MFRDGKSDISKFQQELQKYEFIQSKGKKDSKISSNIHPSTLNTSTNCLEQNQKLLSEVPRIDFLHWQMRMYMDTFPVSSQYHNIKTRNESWNLMFHQILNSCTLKHEYPSSTMPKEYKPNKSCAHLLHVDLELVARKCLYLTMFELLNNHYVKHQMSGLSYFIYTVIFQNPIWDIGFQHKLALQNNGRIYTSKLD